MTDLDWEKMSVDRLSNRKRLLYFEECELIESPKYESNVYQWLTINELCWIAEFKRFRIRIILAAGFVSIFLMLKFTQCWQRRVFEDQGNARQTWPSKMSLLVLIGTFRTNITKPFKVFTLIWRNEPLNQTYLSFIWKKHLKRGN